MTGAESRNSATYLYCLVQSPGLPSVLAETAPRGLPGLSPLRVLPVGGGLWVVAADAPLPEYAAESIQERLQDLSWVSDRALPHEAVIEHFARGGTVIPMKLFTLFASDERALAHLRSTREHLDRVLERVAGRQEWGVRVQFDEARAREVMAGEARRESGRHSAGTAFLVRKKMEQDAVRTLLGRARLEVDRAFAGLAEQADDAVRRELAAPAPTVLDGIFLVPVAGTAAFEQEVDHWAARLADCGCEITLTGPWPPYHFLGEEKA
jgi:hypothetical protein